MLSTNLHNNLLHFINEMHITTRPQIYKFFATYQSDSLDFQIDYLVRTHDVLQKGEFFYSKECSDNETVRATTVKAGWVMASFKEENIKQFWHLDLPQSLLFVTNEDQVYDVTVISSENEAKTVPFLVKRIIEHDTKDGFPDPVNHIAVLNNISNAKIIATAGVFDSFCIIDKMGNPKYYKLGKPATKADEFPVDAGLTAVPDGDTLA